MSTARFLGSIALVTLALAAPAGAHVGSPDTWFEGTAGPYPIRVIVRAPGVVPGLAQIDVRVLEGSARNVTLQPFAWDAGTGGAPPPDIAKPVPGDARLFSVSLWLMAPTVYGVHVRVDGDRGRGLAIVPVQAVATKRLPMTPGLAWILAALGAFLFVGLVTVFGAAVRDASVPSGKTLDGSRDLRARVVMAIAAAVLALGLIGGRRWWNRVDSAHAENAYRPLHVTAGVMDSAGAPWVRLAIDDERWRGRKWTPLITDHGKLMHLFLIKGDDLGSIAHLHPAPRDSDQFESRLPVIPAGRYRVFADIVHESGFAQTLIASLDVPHRAAGIAAGTPSDLDDAWYIGPAAGDSGVAEIRFRLLDGATLVWERGTEPIVEQREHPLRFRVIGPDGGPAILEPYLGMAAHAVVMRQDGGVFAHLHPIGSVSMASQMALTMRTPADSVAGSLGRRLSRADAMHHAMPMTEPSEFSIPYGFPSAGSYRMWVQIKRAGRVQTAAFDLEVVTAKPS